MTLINKARFVALFLPLVGGCAKYEAMPLNSPSVEKTLAAPEPSKLWVAASQIKHPILKPIELNDGPGITPDQAGILAVLMNPGLRAKRDQRQLAAAQLLAAGILPNPQLNFTEDIPIGGTDQGSINAFAVGLSWDVTSLISHDAKVRAAQAQSASVDLDIAWQEWQTAQAARTAAFDVIALQAVVEQSKEVDRELSQNASVIQQAVDRHEKTLLDASAAQVASMDAHIAVISAQRDLGQQRQQLNRALGFSPETNVQVRGNVELPSHVSLPPLEDLLKGLETRRLDLMALKLGYESQEETLRQAVLEQFPKVNLGFNHARDNTNVQSVGFGVTVDLPIFDRNQGAIATQKATRQQLFDEYAQRLFEARSDVAMALEDLAAISNQIDASNQSLAGLQQLVATYHAALQAGNLDVISYYQTVGSLIQKELDILKLKQQLMDNLVALELATGEYFPVTTTAPAPVSATRNSSPAIEAP